MTTATRDYDVVVRLAALDEILERVDALFDEPIDGELFAGGGPVDEIRGLLSALVDVDGGDDETNARTSERFLLVSEPGRFGGDDNPRSYLVVDTFDTDSGTAGGTVVLAGNWHDARTAQRLYNADADAYDAARAATTDEAGF